MRQYLFRGIRVDGQEWVEGYLFRIWEQTYILWGTTNGVPNMIEVVPESVGQCTSMNEFVLTDEGCDAKLFEGDIVEVWKNRQVYGTKWSKYDGVVKFRGVIVFKDGEWCVDFKNKYNESICKARGKEEYDRDMPGENRLYWYGCHRSDIDEYRAKRLEWCRKFHKDDEIVEYDDIKRIGTVFENSELLEG